MTYSHTNQTA